jgi:predicted Zn-dependent protease
LQETRLDTYMDPPTWWYPVRRSVAAAYLKAGDNVRAEVAAKQSLATWKHDPLALWVLAKAESGEGKTADSAAHMAEARRLWRGDFDSITVDGI